MTRSFVIGDIAAPGQEHSTLFLSNISLTKLIIGENCVICGCTCATGESSAYYVRMTHDHSDCTALLNI